MREEKGADLFSGGLTGGTRGKNVIDQRKEVSDFTLYGRKLRISSTSHDNLLGKTKEREGERSLKPL